MDFYKGNQINSMRMYNAVLVVFFISFTLGVDFYRKDCLSNDKIRGVDSHSIFFTQTNDTTPCRVLSDLDLPVNVNYDVSVTFQFHNSTPGIIFNVRDDDNYDIIYFRPFESDCVVTASMKDGVYEMLDAHYCYSGDDVIDLESWFDVVLEVRQTTFNVIISDKITLTLPSYQLQHPSVGIIHGLEYKHLCEFKCQFNFRSLKLIPDTRPEHFNEEYGTLTIPSNPLPKQLRVQKVEFFKLCREPGKLCFVAFNFVELNLSQAKIYILNDDKHTKGAVKIYSTFDPEIDVFFYAHDMDFHSYTIMYNVFGCGVPEQEGLSFFCQPDQHSNSYTGCEKSTGYMSDTSNYISDDNMLMGWYGFDSCAGDSMPTESPGRGNVCGTKNPIWLRTPESGGINSNGSTNATACVYQSKNNECAEEWQIPVYGCNSSFIIYYLVPTPIDSAYCAGDLDFCNTSLDFSEIGGPVCSDCSAGCRSHSLDPGIIALICIASILSTVALTGLAVGLFKKYKKGKRNDFYNMDNIATTGIGSPHDNAGFSKY